MMTFPLIALASPARHVIGFLLLVTWVMVPPAQAQVATVATAQQVVSIPPGWSGDLPFGTPSVDTGGFWQSSAPTRYTVPIDAMTVQVTAYVEFPYTCTVCTVFVVKNDNWNGAFSYGATAHTGFGWAAFTAVTPVLGVNAGDYFSVRVFHNADGPIDATVRLSIVQMPPMPGDLIARTAHLSGTVTVPAGWPPVQDLAPSLAWDSAGMWNSAAPERLTVPSGVTTVQVLARANFSYLCTTCAVYLVRNDADFVAASYGATANTGFGGAMFTAIAPNVSVQPGDAFTVRAYQGTGAPLEAEVQLTLTALDGFALSGAVQAASATEWLSVPDGWGGDLAFTQAQANVGGWWSASAPTRMTVPSGVGHVQVDAFVEFDYSCTVCLAYIVKNGNEVVASSYGSTASSGFGSVRFTTFAPIVAVQPGDYFTVRAYQDTGAPLVSPARLSIVALGGPLGPSPVISSLSPASAAAGYAVTLTGSDFGITQGTSRVRFAGSELSATVTAWSDTSITAVVPPWAVSGNVTVKVSGQTSNGVAFTLIQAPAITGLSPSWGAVGDEIEIIGERFGTGGTVTFASNVNATVMTEWTASRIKVAVPAGAQTGGLQVTVTATGLGSNVVPFTVGTEEMLYYHTDGIGSVRMITGADGLVLERHDYLPFGEEWPPRPDEAHIGFGGKEKDQETGSGSWMALNYLGARHLHSAIGRFTSVDPVSDASRNLADPQSWNRYIYVRNNPLRLVDPDGRFWKEVLAVLFGLEAELHAPEVGQEDVDPENPPGWEDPALIAGVILGPAGSGLKRARVAATEFAEGELEKHFLKHAAEWGAGNITKAAYLKRASTLLDSDIGGDIYGFVRKNGDILRYNRRTNEFAAQTADGRIKTLFRPKDGLNYWLDQTKPVK
jgi:RHS repeat-associated protein